VDFKELLKVARRRWLTIAAMLAVALAGSLALSLTATPEYSSSARIFISADISNTADAYAASLFSAQRVTSYADLATSRELLTKVLDRTGSNLTPTELAGRIKASVIQDTVIITLDVTDPSPQMAQRLAQAESQELATYIDDIETHNTKQGTVKATVIDPASFDDAKVSPHTGLNLGVAAVLGLLIGFGVAMLRDVLDSSVKTAADVAETVDLPVMASVDFDKHVARRPLMVDRGAEGARAEAYRLLRTNVQFLDIDSGVRSIVITSAVPGEGKTTTAANFAAAVAQAGRRVLLVDGDLRRPRVAELLGLAGNVGLTNILVGQTTIEETVQRHAQSGIHVLASGPVPPNPSEILQSRAARELFEKVAAGFDLVVIDAPPLLPVADAAIMAASADGAILVVRHGRTTRDQLQHAAQRLASVGARSLGVVLNRTPPGSHGYGYDRADGYRAAHRS
jgi:receptor protein-tyrosine kinase